MFLFREKKRWKAGIALNPPKYQNRQLMSPAFLHPSFWLKTKYVINPRYDVCENIPGHI